MSSSFLKSLGESVALSQMRESKIETVSEASKNGNFEPKSKANLVSEDNSDSFYDSVKYTFKLMISRRMLWLFPQMIWTGISIAYWSGLVTIIVVRTIPDKSSSEQLI